MINLASPILLINYGMRGKGYQFWLSIRWLVDSLVQASVFHSFSWWRRRMPHRGSLTFWSFPFLDVRWWRPVILVVQLLRVWSFCWLVLQVLLVLVQSCGPKVFSVGTSSILCCWKRQQTSCIVFGILLSTSIHRMMAFLPRTLVANTALLASLVYRTIGSCW